LSKKQQTKYKFPIEGEHHVVELFRGENCEDTNDMVTKLQEQARQTGHTVRAISYGLELVAYGSYPSVSGRWIGS